MTASAPVGRPLKFESVEALETKIEAYFSECDREEDTRIYEHGPTVQNDYEDLDKEGNRVSATPQFCDGSAPLRMMIGASSTELSGAKKSVSGSNTHGASSKNWSSTWRCRLDQESSSVSVTTKP